MVEPNLLTVFETPPDRPEESLPVVDLPGVPTEVKSLPLVDLPVIDLQPTQEVGCRIEAALGKPKSKKKPQPQTRQLAPWQKLPVEKSPKKSKAKPKKSKANQSRAKNAKPM